MDISGLRYIDMIDKLVITKAKITYKGQDHYVKLTLLEPSKLTMTVNPDGTTTSTYNGEMIIAPVDETADTPPAASEEADGG